MLSRSNIFLVGALGLAVTLFSLRLFVHSVSVQNRSAESARVTCSPFVSVAVGTKESRYLKYSLWGTSMNCDVLVGGHRALCSADLAPLGVAFVEIGPTGRVECQSFE
jgi:hypothetical protein